MLIYQTLIIIQLMRCHNTELYQNLSLLTREHFDLFISSLLVYVIIVLRILVYTLYTCR